MTVPLNWSMPSGYTNGSVTIDWGDGSQAETEAGSYGTHTNTHTYASTGNYVITLSPSTSDSSLLQIQLADINGNNGIIPTVPYSKMLKKAEIGTNVVNYFSHSFANCKNLKYVTVPTALTYVGTYAFMNCTSLEMLVLSDQTTLTSSGLNFNRSKVVFPRYITGLQTVYRYSGVLSTIVPEVSSIGSSSFIGCDGLSEVIIPDTVTSIGASAFEDCTGVRKYDFTHHQSIPSCTSNSFLNIDANCKIVVPDALYEDWKTTSYWSSYASKIISASDYANL